MDVFTVAVVVVLASLAWQSRTRELRPGGIHMRSALNAQLIPWEAIEPGGPPRPSSSAFDLRVRIWCGEGESDSDPGCQRS